jgi:hypothetical protein
MLLSAAPAFATDTRKLVATAERFATVIVDTVVFVRAGTVYESVSVAADGFVWPSVFGCVAISSSH